MSTRKLNALELKIHQAALGESQKTLTQKELDAVAPDAVARTAALNFLLSTGMLKVMKDAKGVVSFRAVMKKEMDVKKDMSGEETMVLNHIQASGNEGIWTKHLKAKTELHQTVIDRCLKSLVQKQLVKAVKSVKHPTRKIYMLSHLDPSVEITGGPWYTDNELDTEFIKLLSGACLHYIKDRSFPKQKRTKNNSSSSQPLFPIAAAPSYPNAQQIQAFLSKSKITETQLTVEHVEMLLKVLVLDGEVEKVPAFGAAMWESHANADQDEGSEDDQTDKKRKSKSNKGSRRLKRRKKSKDMESESEDESSAKPKSNKRKKVEVSDTTEDDDSDREKGKKKKRRVSEMDAEESTDSERGRNEKRKKKLKRRDSSSDRSSTSESSESEDERPRRKKSTSRKRSASPTYDFNASAIVDDSFGSAYVYRAVRQERIALGWSQAPCGRCPVFEFCKDKGPVNPQECTYYEDWLGNATVAAE